MEISEMFFESDNEIIIELIDMFGLENTQKFIDTFGGTQLYVPQMKTIVREYRNRSIYKDFLSGMSYRKLCDKYRVSEMSLRRVIKFQAEKERQSERERKNKLTY